jgi:integrase
VTTFHEHLADYLRVRRALGFKLEQAGELLPDFVRYLDARHAAHVTSRVAVAWATQPRETQPAWWRRRLVVVRGFAKYLHTLDRRHEVPPIDLLPAQRARTIPYVYSDGDVQALLQGTEILRHSFRTLTYRTLFGLIAATGMRVGEAIALDVQDFDPRRAALMIRKSKFDKSRQLPLHPTTVRALASYLHQRSPGRRRSSLFCSTTGTRLFYQNVHDTFLRVLYAAGLGERTPRPTIHDLRHTFAIRTVLDWHRAGLDVEARLPSLSTYLGHIGPSSTYWYLTAVPELMEVAVRRLERFSKVRA